MISNYRCIKTCLNEIEAKIKLGDSSKWTDPDYRVLSKDIEKVTHVNISAQTLKRYYGKIQYKTKFNPQGATRDALAVYLGYKDWEHYKSAKSTQVTKTRRKLITPFYVFIIAIISALICLLLIWIHREIDPLISLEIRNTAGHVPHSIEVEYEINPRFKDSLFLDLGYIHKVQGYQRIYLDPLKSRINHSFQEPGYYTVIVSSANGELAKANIHVISEGWACNILPDMKASQVETVANSFTVYPISDALLSEGNGYMYFPPETVYGLGANKQYDYKLRFFQFKDYGVSADSCILEFRFKNSTEDGGISCFDTMLSLIAENGRIFVNMMEIGCIAWTYLTVSELDIDGQFTDLSPLCRVMSDWTDMKIVVDGMVAKILFNGEIAYSVPYNQALGDIKGLRFGFKGSGKADYIRLRDSEGKLAFSDEFD